MKRLFVDLSLTVQTGAGSAVYAWEICHRLMRLAAPLQVLPLTNPFRTHGRIGMRRKIHALLRDLLWRPCLAGLEARTGDCFLFTNTFVPRGLMHREYAVILLDLGAWHDRSLLSWRGRLGMRALPKVLARATHVFAISDHTARDAAREFSIPRERITLAPCGLSAGFTRPAQHQTEINGIPLPGQYLLHVGSLEPKKNIPFLLQVFALAREMLKTSGHGSPERCKLVLTGGESWHDDHLRRLITAHPFARDIVILGNVPARDLPALYRQAAALVFPSLLEGFGLPVIEALSQGTPVLVQANSSLTQFGTYGATVMEDFQAESWVNRLLPILAANQRITDAQIHAVRETFDWDRTANIIFRTLLGSKEDDAGVSISSIHDPQAMDARHG
ncbi:glycosyltransferase family 4 protein [Desulfonatronum parangueonense]